jgi:hypothetical protein
MLWSISLLPIGLLCALGLGILFVVKGWQAGLQVLVQNAPETPLPVVARENPAPSPPPTVPVPTSDRQAGSPLSSGALRPAGQAEAPEPTVIPENAAPEAVADTGIAVAQPIPNPAPVASFPELKLQGIYYRPANPSVVINTKTLYRGDKIQQAQVTQITKDSVTVVWHGETKVLTME